jgi:hypothetical protein
MNGCARKNSRTCSSGISREYLNIRPINPASLPARGDLDKITAATRALASHGLRAGRGNDV